MAGHGEEVPANMNVLRVRGGPEVGVHVHMNEVLDLDAVCVRGACIHTNVRPCTWLDSAARRPCMAAAGHGGADIGVRRRPWSWAARVWGRGQPWGGSLERRARAAPPRP